MQGVTTTGHVKRLIESDLAKPTLAEISARIKAIEPLVLPGTTAEMIRHERDSR